MIESLSKNLIGFYPKNYDIPVYIKPDYLFKPMEIWHIEFEEIIDSEIFLTNCDLEYAEIFGECGYNNTNSIKNKSHQSLDESMDAGSIQFYVGKTLKPIRFIQRRKKLDINDVTTLKDFKRIFHEYISDMREIEKDEIINSKADDLLNTENEIN